MKEHKPRAPGTVEFEKELPKTGSGKNLQKGLARNITVSARKVNQ
ncbi:MAG: hypothetical protein U0103_11625 [Candidatus Obscuribacterales bacterium]